ncbi:DEAD/DEAH box helicase [Glutamicibacter endophyticus]
MNDAAPILDSRVLLAYLGNAPYFYGQQLAARESVAISCEFDNEKHTITGRILETAEEQEEPQVLAEPGLKLVRSGSGWQIDEAWCDCDQAPKCKHVAALAIASGKQASATPATGTPATVERSHAAWEETINSWYEPMENDPEAGLTGSANDPVTPMALQVMLFDAHDASATQWAPTGHQLPAAVRHQRFRLGVRPMVRNAEGRWVRGQLRWTTLVYKTFGWNLLRTQHHWFARFAALAHANTQLQFKVDEDWLYLDEYSSPLLWSMLEETSALGIELLPMRAETSIVLLEPATHELQAHCDETGDIHLTGALRLGEEIIPLSADTPAGTIGNHGYYLQLQQPSQILLAPSREPLPTETRRWFTHREPLQIPQDDREHFLADNYPLLARRFAVRSIDEQLQLPELQPPVVRARVDYKRSTASGSTEDTAELSFTIKYPGIDERHDVHDAAAERELIALVDDLFTEQTGLHNADLSPRFFTGEQLIDFVSSLLPALQGTERIEVVERGTRPVFRQLSELPQLKINAVPSEQNDWLDLGLLITIGSYEVPFATIVKALSTGAMKVKLPDDTWFSLDQPLFAKLKALVDEAQRLNDVPPEGDLRVTLMQVSLFGELDELAEGVDGADLFIARMRALLNIAEAPDPEVPAALDATLRPYQREGYAWLTRLYHGGFGGILADDMGLGKTLQTIALILHVHEVWADATAKEQLPAAQRQRAPFLVVAPSSVVSNWETEIRRFAPGLNVASVDGTLASAQDLAQLCTSNDIVLTTYTLLRLNDELYEGQRFAGLVLDEAQFVKNRSTKAYRVAGNLDAPFKLAVTGTPMENNLTELGSLLHLIAPALFISTAKFNRQFARPIEVLGDTDTLNLLQRRIKPFMLRRTKESVVLDLPAKQEQQVLVTLTEEHQHVYDTHLNRERQKILRLIDDLDKNRFTIFQSLTHLRMLALEPSLVDPELANVPGSKLAALFEQLEDVLSEGHRALVFSQFTSYLKVFARQLEERGIDFVYLDGNTRNRSEVINQFKEGRAPLFLISLKAGGFGLNLTEADYCFLLDPWWNPAVEAQAVDRTHRIGQKRHVMVYRMISKGTIEEKVVALQQAKRELISTVMDDGDGFAKALSAQDIRELLE